MTGINSNSRLVKECLGYSGIGLLQLLLDWLCFIGLTSLGFALISSNLVGRVAGALLGFWLNRVITFREQSKNKPGWRQFMRFAISWGGSSFLGTLGVYLVGQGAGLHWAWWVKPAIDGALAGLGFVMSRYWIYR